MTAVVLLLMLGVRNSGGAELGRASAGLCHCLVASWLRMAASSWPAAGAGLTFLRGCVCRRPEAVRPLEV